VSDAVIEEPGETAAIVAAAVEGPLSFAIRDSPEWLSRPSSADELTAIALGYLRLRRKVAGCLADETPRTRNELAVRVPVSTRTAGS
jgi:hypothetical protein